jgi:HD superfamily phosphohydrolase
MAASSTEHVIAAEKVFNDCVHGHIELSTISAMFIDTVQFQRLRDLRQLGGVYEVFPCADHQRFEHCLGVAHLARLFVRQLSNRHPELHVTEQEMICVEVAGNRLLMY